MHTGVTHCHVRFKRGLERRKRRKSAEQQRFVETILKATKRTMAFAYEGNAQTMNGGVRTSKSVLQVEPSVFSRWPTATIHSNISQATMDPTCCYRKKIITSVESHPVISRISDACTPVFVIDPPLHSSGFDSKRNPRKPPINAFSCRPTIL